MQDLIEQLAQTAEDLLPTVNYRKSRDNTPDLEYQTEGAAGIDLTAMQIEYDEDKEQTTIFFGIEMAIPEGWVGLLFPRSSIRKTRQRMSNCVGVIDCDFRGEVRAIFDNHERYGKVYELGERCAQLVLVPAPQAKLTCVEKLCETKRGDGGFGSTGA